MTDRSVPFPWAGADAFLRLDFDGLEALEADFGPAVLAILEAGLVGGSPVITTHCLAVMLQGEDEDGLADAPWDMALDEIGALLLDAVYLRRYGKTVAEFTAEQIAIAGKQHELLERWAEEKTENFAGAVNTAMDAQRDALKRRIAKRLAAAAVKTEASTCQP